MMDSVMRTLLVLSAWLCVQGRLDDDMRNEDFQQSGRIPTTTCLPMLNQGCDNDVIAAQLRIFSNKLIKTFCYMHFLSNILILIKVAKNGSVNLDLHIELCRRWTT